MPSLSGASVTLIVRGCSIDFSNVLTKTVIERLADADEYEAVREVQVIPLSLHLSSYLTRPTRNTLPITPLSFLLSFPSTTLLLWQLLYMVHLQALGMQKHLIDMCKD
jgi:hypothetical protein